MIDTIIGEVITIAVLGFSIYKAFKLFDVL